MGYAAGLSMSKLCQTAFLCHKFSFAGLNDLSFQSLWPQQCDASSSEVVVYQSGCVGHLNTKKMIPRVFTGLKSGPLADCGRQNLNSKVDSKEMLFDIIWHVLYKYSPHAQLCYWNMTPLGIASQGFQRIRSIPQKQLSVIHMLSLRLTNNN